jgi:hypothetical protein
LDSFRKVNNIGFILFSDCERKACYWDGSVGRLAIVQRDQNITQNIKAADANGHGFHIGYF